MRSTKRFLPPFEGTVARILTRSAFQGPGVKNLLSQFHVRLADVLGVLQDPSLNSFVAPIFDPFSKRPLGQRQRNKMQTKLQTFIY